MSCAHTTGQAAPPVRNGRDDLYGRESFAPGHRLGKAPFSDGPEALPRPPFANAARNGRGALARSPRPKASGSLAARCSENCRPQRLPDASISGYRCKECQIGIDRTGHRDHGAELRPRNLDRASAVLARLHPDALKG